LDLAKAFDVVNHEILLAKLQVIGIRNNANSWFRNYLSDRKQFVFCNYFGSDFQLNCNGVPQGSILGPLLFLIFIDDIKDVLLAGDLQLFADDIAIIYSNENWDQIENNMNSDLKQLEIWMARNKLVVNTKKSIYITFGNHEEPDLNIIFSNDKLKLMQTVKYLGIYIDKKLNFKEHINFIVKKCSSIIGILFKLRHVLPLSVKKLIYFSLIHSHITYACEVWGHTSNIYLEKINIVQKKAVKAMNGQSFTSHSFPIFCENKILPFRHIVKLQSCIFIHNAINSFIHSNTNLILNSNFHNYNTRFANNLMIERNFSTRYGTNSTINSSKKFYNDDNTVPQIFKNLSKIIFKRKLKSHFIISFLRTP
jgi:Reverse transcriptase (RNA-dependent DNA polymerase)